MYMYDFIFNEGSPEPKKQLCVRGFTDEYREMLYAVLSDRFEKGEAPLLVIAEGESLINEQSVPANVIGAPTQKRKKNRIYLSRPVDIALLRKSALSLVSEKETVPDPDVVSISREELSVSYKGETVSLTRLEFGLFLMLKDADVPLSREDIRASLWADTDGTNISDVYVCYLRKKLSGLFGEGFLTSVRGKGYVMRLP